MAKTMGRLLVTSSVLAQHLGYRQHWWYHTLQLPSEPISKNEYAKHLVQRISEAHKLFSSIKKDLRRRQRDYYDLSANVREFSDGQQGLVRNLEPLGKAPVSEAYKHLYSVYPAAKQILAKLGRMRGLTAHFPYLSLEGDPSGGVCYLVLD